MNNAEIINDFRRRYEGTFVWLSMDEITKETLVKVTRIEDDVSKMGVLRLDSLEYGSLSINMGSDGHTLLFKYPPVGVFQHATDAFVFTRRPARQYRRGICADNSTLRSVTAGVAGNIARFEARTIASAFEHKTYPVQEALRMLRSGRVRSVALNNNYSLCLSHTSVSKDFVVFHWTLPVGKVDASGRLGMVYEDVYKSELNRIFNNDTK